MSIPYTNTRPFGRGIEALFAPQPVRIQVEGSHVDEADRLVAQALDILNGEDEPNERVRTLLVAARVMLTLAGVRR